jgi:hypothetical protein
MFQYIHWFRNLVQIKPSLKYKCVTYNEKNFTAGGGEKEEEVSVLCN